MENFGSHQMPMGFLGKNGNNQTVTQFYWGENNYAQLGISETLWTTGQSGNGPGKINYDIVRGIESFSDKSLVILEGSPDNTIERWNIGTSATFTNFSAGGSGDADNKFYNPKDVTVDQDDNIYVLDILSNGQPRIKMFSPEFVSLGGFGNSTQIPGTAIAIDWDDYKMGLHVLTTTGVKVFYSQT